MIALILLNVPTKTQHFDSSAKNYQRVIYSSKLIYLIQHCKGKAKKLIKDCEMTAQPDCDDKARQILKSEFGKYTKLQDRMLNLLQQESN